MSNTMNYFLKDIMAKTKINTSNWCLEDFLKNKELVGVACKKTNRNFVGIELLKCWFDVALERIQNE